MNRDEAKTIIIDKFTKPYSFGDINNLVDSIYDSFEYNNCNNCKFRDTQRPVSHPNWRECNNRDSIMSYTETEYDWLCKDWETIDNDTSNDGSKFGNPKFGG